MGKSQLITCVTEDENWLELTLEDRHKAKGNNLKKEKKKRKSEIFRLGFRNLDILYKHLAIGNKKYLVNTKEGPVEMSSGETS